VGDLSNALVEQAILQGELAATQQLLIETQQRASPSAVDQRPTYSEAKALVMQSSASALALQLLLVLPVRDAEVGERRE
jgi:hypothetical protein